MISPLPTGGAPNTVAPVADPPSSPEAFSELSEAALPTSATKPATPATSQPSRGVTQLSLVEHALCQLDAQESLRRGMVFDTHYFRHTAQKAERVDVEVTAGHGLSASDELVLWGLLALVAADQSAGSVYHATPHYVLRRLGLSNQSKGGVNYAEFRATMKRLGALSLYSRKFYDPELGEEREVVLRFVSGSLPLGEKTARAWRFHFDTQLVGLVRHPRGGMRFDLATYRQLGCAERRAFLALAKIFHRRRTSPAYDVRHLAVNVLGYSPTLPQKTLNRNVTRVLTKLLAAGIISLPMSVTHIKQLLTKHAKGVYRVRLTRGPYFEKRAPTTIARHDWRDSPLYDPIRAIGFAERDIRWFLATYEPRILQAWADVTLAAMEGKAHDFPGFQKNPQAYFRYHVEAHATRAILGEPDWYLAFRKDEERRQFERDQAADAADAAHWRTAYETARSEKLAELITADQPGYDRLLTLVTEFYAARHGMNDRTRSQVKTETESRLLAQHKFPAFEVWRARQYIDLRDRPAA